MAFPLVASTRTFVETAQASEALKARPRQMRDDFVRASVLATDVQRPSDDSDAHLAAGLIAATWSLAFIVRSVPNARRDRVYVRVLPQDRNSRD